MTSLLLLAHAALGVPQFLHSCPYITSPSHLSLSKQTFIMIVGIWAITIHATTLYLTTNGCFMIVRKQIYPFVVQHPDILHIMCAIWAAHMGIWSCTVRNNASLLMCTLVLWWSPVNFDAVTTLKSTMASLRLLSVRPTRASSFSRESICSGGKLEQSPGRSTLSLLDAFIKLCPSKVRCWPWTLLWSSIPFPWHLSLACRNYQLCGERTCLLACLKIHGWWSVVTCFSSWPLNTWSQILLSSLPSGLISQTR